MTEFDNDDFRESFHNFMRKVSGEDTAALFMRPHDEQISLWEEQLAGDGATAGAAPEELPTTEEKLDG